MGNKADKKKRKKKCDREDHPDRAPQTKNTVLKKISPKRKDNPNSKDKSGQASNSAKKEQKETVKKKIKEKADAKGGEVNWEGKSEKSGKSEPSAKKAKDALKSIKTAKSVKSKANEGKHKDKSDRCKPKSKQMKENKAPVGTGKHSQSADKPCMAAKENDTVAGYEKSIISSQTAKQEVYPPQSPKSNTAQRPAAATNAKKKKKKKIKNIDKLKKFDKKKKPKEPKPTSKEKRDYEVDKSHKNQVPDPPLVIAEVTGQTQPKESSVKSKTIEMTLADKDDTVGLPTKQNQDQAMGSLDSQIELDLGKSDGSPKSDGLSGQDEDQAYADERLNPIFKEEFEHLYEKLKTLNRAVLTLKESYRDHIRSLVKLSKQTGEERTAVNSDDESVDEKKSLPTNMLINISDLKTTISEGEGGGGKERKTKKDTDITTRYRLDAFKSDVFSTKVLIVDSRFDMAHFLDPQRTRENTFRDLFNEVGSLNDSLNRLKDFYDSDGDFMIQEYETSDYRISRNTFDTVRQKTQMLLTIVQKVTRIYNQDLLDMFRIKS